jgi:hypothetical protein
MPKEPQFKLPSQYWTHDSEAKLAESNKSLPVAFKMPIFNTVELDSEGKPKIDPETKKPIIFNIFERSLDILFELPEVLEVMKRVGFINLDQVFMNTTNEQIKKWREFQPKGKSGTIAQLFPNPYLGRKAYYMFVMFENEMVWETEKDVNGNVVNKLDKDGKPIMKDGKPVPKNKKVIKKNDKNENCLKFGQLEKFKEDKGGRFILYWNTWKKSEVFENDENGNPVKKEGTGTFQYEQVEARSYDKTIIDYIEKVEQMALKASAALASKIDKCYGFVLSGEIKEDKTAFYKHSCVADYIVFT